MAFDPTPRGIFGLPLKPRSSVLGGPPVAANSSPAPAPALGTPSNGLFTPPTVSAATPAPQPGETPASGSVTPGAPLVNGPAQPQLRLSPFGRRRTLNF